MKVGFRNKVILRFFYCSIFLFIGFSVFSQNDVCASATALSLGTTVGATTSSFTNTTGDPSTPSCSADSRCSFTGWYKYTTGASGGDLTLSMTTGVGAIKYGSYSIY